MEGEDLKRMLGMTEFTRIRKKVFAGGSCWDRVSLGLIIEVTKEEDLKRVLGLIGGERVTYSSIVKLIMSQ